MFILLHTQKDAWCSFDQNKGGKQGKRNKMIDLNPTIAQINSTINGLTFQLKGRDCQSRSKNRT